MLSVSLPELLENESLLVGQGSSGVQALPNHRWAELLRDAVPRVLLQDLQRLRGAAQMWAAPVPPGVAVQRQLRVPLLALQTDAARSQVSLLARVVSADADGRSAPRVPAAERECARAWRQRGRRGGRAPLGAVATGAVVAAAEGAPVRRAAP